MQNSLILFREHLGMTFQVQADDGSDEFSIMTGPGTSTPISGGGLITWMFMN